MWFLFLFTTVYTEIYFFLKNIKCKNAFLYCSYLSAKMSLTTEMYNVYEECIFLIYVILIYRRHNSPSPSTELLAWSWIFWIMLTYSHLRETSKEGQRPITIWVKFYSSFLTHRHLQKIAWSQKQNELNMNKLESLFQFFQMFLWYWYR